MSPEYLVDCNKINNVANGLNDDRYHNLLKVKGVKVRKSLSKALVENAPKDLAQFFVLQLSDH